MRDCKCRWSKCLKKSEFRDRLIEMYKPGGEKPWVVVPKEPATHGHLVVVSGKCYADVGDTGLLQDTDQLKRIMKTISELSATMKKSLTHNGKKCERVYVVSECETPNLHLHFHLIPRFHGDKKGHIFLFERELEEARWKLKKDTDEDKIRDAYHRIATAEGILDYHRNLIQTDRWLRSDVKREEFSRRIKLEVDEILMKKS